MGKETKFVRGNQRIDRLVRRPDIAKGVARTRRTMADADRAYAAGLAEVRKAAELTQAELGRKLGVSQAAISQVETPHDMLLSTLNDYLLAVGAHATVVVHFDDGRQVELDLSQLADAG
jgi:DNA-binding XRE family transcriptional regulator